MNQTEKNVTGIVANLQKYLDLRFSHATRINPHYERIEADLEWHQLDAIRHIISRKKPMAEFRVAVADLLVSCDADVRRSVFAPKGQLSIFNEVIPIDDTAKHKGEVLSINDLLALYSAIDPSLKTIMELLRTWVWWDLPDATLVYMFESGVERMGQVMGGGAGEELISYYKTLDAKGAPIPLNLSSKQGILDFEFYRIEEAFHIFEKRRQEEGKFQQIVAWESESGLNHAEVEGLIHQMAQHLRARDAVAKTGQVEPTLRDYYAKATQCAVEEVSPARIMDFERVYLDKAMQDLMHVLREDAGGERYDFKWRQYTDMSHTLDSARAQVNPTPIVAKQTAREEAF